MVSIIASHNISIKQSVYDKLKEIKRENESFSDLIERMFDEGEKGTFSRLKKHFQVDTSIPELDDELKKVMHKARKNINKDLETATTIIKEVIE